MAAKFNDEINTASQPVVGYCRGSNATQICKRDAPILSASSSEVVELSEEFSTLPQYNMCSPEDVPLLTDFFPSSGTNEPNYGMVGEISHQSDVPLLTDIEEETSHSEEVTDQLADLPALPENKSYHVMFSFSSEDRSWVRAVLEKLEAQPYNLKCGISDRHFHPGMDVLNNIEELMSKSLNIIMVISPEHLDSGYCDFEINLAMEHVHQKRAKIIPVLLRGENVPSNLRFINYIDGRDAATDKVVDTIYKAAIEGLQMKRQHHILLDPCVRNGEEVRWTFGRNKKCDGPWSCIFPRIQDPTEDLLQQCRHLEMKISLKILYMLGCYLNSHRYVVTHWLINTPCGWTFLFFKIGLFIGLLFMLESAFFLLTIFAGFLWLPLVVLVMRRRTKSAQIQSSGELSRATYNKKFLVCVGDEKHKPVIRLIKYDVINCQEYILENMIIQKDSYTNEDRLKVTRSILEAGLLMYPEVFLDSSLVAAQVRHPVRRDLVCLCQFIETRGIHLDVQKEPKPSLLGVVRNWWRSGRRNNEDRHELIQNTDEALIV